MLHSVLLRVKNSEQLDFLATRNAFRPGFQTKFFITWLVSQSILKPAFS